jgi:phosphate-selective porin OprO and OprP
VRTEKAREWRDDRRPPSINKFVKVYFNWEHAMFGSPGFSNNGPAQTSNDLFWIRPQVYF